MNAKHCSLILSVLLCSFTASAQFFIEPNIGVQMNSTKTIETSLYSSFADRSTDMSYGLNFGRSLSSKLDLRMNLSYSSITRGLLIHGLLFNPPEKVRRANFQIGIQGDYYFSQRLGLLAGINIAIHSRYQWADVLTFDGKESYYYPHKEGSTRSKAVNIGLTAKLTKHIRVRAYYSFVFDMSEFMTFDIDQKYYLSLRLGYAFNL